MKTLHFFKMEGAGNDFVVIDNRTYGFTLDEIIAFTPTLCNRRFGVGADGLLVLEPTTTPELDYTMIYRNADGSDAGMCGNGARCLAMFAAHHGFGNKQTFNVHDAVYTAEVDKIEHQVTIHFPDVAAPKWIEVAETKLLQVFTGTEHVVCFTDRSKLDEEEDLVAMGRNIREHPDLNPPGTNVNFVSIANEQAIHLQTYERGVEDLTLACGTGALASAISAHFLMGAEEQPKTTRVHVKGGDLNVSFVYNKELQRYQQLTLTGAARFVFEGTINT